MDASTALLSLLETPFPGLRPFSTEESFLFFGREEHGAELLRRLSENRFLAITGGSGCGKSSLVYAGLLPALYRGHLVNATSRWRIAAFRPGKAPLDALAAALAKEEALGLDVKALRERLGATSGGLVAAVRSARLAPGESLLVVADQFEELFRLASEDREGDSERALFVSQLLHAVESAAPIYVVLTMRSDYQGACAQFPGLPEALNRSQYLVSRMTREQYRQAIVKPLDLVGAGITPRLVNQMLNDTGDDPDQLPVLQHALLRTYRHWKKTEQGPIDLDHYRAEDVGGIDKALALHGDGILARFPGEPLAEKIFRCLTGPEGRRPKELHEIDQIVNARSEPARKRVRGIINAFSQRDDSLLMLSTPELVPDTVVDITHESLIRKWPTLADWVKEETKSADWYGDLARDVVLKRSNEAEPWQDPKLSLVLERYNLEGWNQDWALQYRPSGDPPFDEVKTFLDDSVKAQARRRRRERLAGRLLLALLATIALAVSVIYVRDQQHERTVSDLSNKYLDVEQKSRSAQQEADRLKARLAAAQREFATAGPARQRMLLNQLQALESQYASSQAKAGSLESDLTELRQARELATSDQNKVIRRIDDLQAELAAMTNERDRLKSDLEASTTAQERDAGRLKTEVEDWKRQTGEALAELQHLAIPPSFIYLSNGAEELSLAPSGKTIILTMARILNSDFQQEVRLYVWIPPLPIKRMPSGKCGVDGFLCLDVRRLLVEMGPESPVKLPLTVGNVRYEIRVVKWFDDPEALGLLIYPVPSSAKSPQGASGAG